MPGVLTPFSLGYQLRLKAPFSLGYQLRLKGLPRVTIRGLHSLLNHVCYVGEIVSKLRVRLNVFESPHRARVYYIRLVACVCTRPPRDFQYFSPKADFQIFLPRSETKGVVHNKKKKDWKP
jgi:hypothetical protein